MHLVEHSYSDDPTNWWIPNRACVEAMLRSSGFEIVSRPEDASIVRAIVSLAHSLRLKVVAEGVETPAQLDFLKLAGCDEYQGYHFSRPLPAAEFEALIRASHSGEVFTEDDAARTHSKLSFAHK